MEDEENPRLELAGSDSSGFDIAGETFSIDSSITAYRMENGRRYHSYHEGSYWQPNDEKQNENLDIAHHKFLLLLDGKLTLAPLKQNIQRVLDIGTGTGIWAIDFADEFPHTTVLGTDLSPIQPDLVPPNCRFEIDDARDDWTYPKDDFDFIHIRSLFGSIDDWNRLYKQAYDHLKPGGYIEQIEISIDLLSNDGPITPENAVYKFSELFTDAGETTGQTFRTYDLMRKGIEDAGFVNLVEKIYQTPLGGWPRDPKLRELGRWELLGFDVGLEGYAMSTFTRIMGWNTAEVQVLLAQVRATIRDRKLHSYHNIKVVYAQKPLSEPA